MKIIDNINKREAGQVIPLVVLMMFVIIGMVALILDGGAIMSNRRTAQAAADAGALAGAYYLCAGDTTKAKEVAEDYATNENNGATYAVATLPNVNEITVLATVEHASFFAKIFGEKFLKATAEATAGCYYPSVAKRILPIAFYYESPPVNAGKAVCIKDGSCDLVNWHFGDLMPELRDTEVVNSFTKEINLPLDDIYVISEKTKVCEKDVTGAIVCSEMAANASGGNRSFLDFGENLSKIIQNGVTNPIHTPAWLNGQPGAVAAVYNTANYAGFEPIEGYEDLDARMYFVPVFDMYCVSGNTCQPDPDPYYDKVYDYLVSENQQAYRLIGFAPFVVTCVTKNEQCVFGECVPAGTWKLGEDDVTVKKDICPGYLAQDPLLETKDDAIEGYFVDQIHSDEWVWGTEGVDVGVYLISLSK